MICSRNLLLRDLSFHQILKKSLSFFSDATGNEMHQGEKFEGKEQQDPNFKKKTKFARF